MSDTANGPRSRTRAEAPAPPQRVRVIDSHTAGEPTRLVLEGGPDLGSGPLEERLARFRAEHDRFRSAVVNEPRGSDALVGALLCEPHRAGCQAGVIFFNNVGFLGMCGHGAIGVVASLAALGRIAPGELRLDTPVGVVKAELHASGAVSLENVPSRRVAKGVAVKVAGVGEVAGDVAWGGNWFFLAERPELALDVAHVEELTAFAWRVREAVNAQGHPEVDHVELFGRATTGAHARSFVLCPGNAYDRSPCGTGTSAKLACLAADGKLEEGAEWVQESVIGSRFRARYRWLDRARGEIAPVITGEAHVTAEAELRLDPADPFCWGIR
jgi:4-hydroxyproline epimerase